MASVGDVERTGHPEVEERHGGAVQFEPQLLAQTLHAADGPAGEGAGEGSGGDAVDHDAVIVALHTPDQTSFGHLGGHAASPFDFWQFRHGRNSSHGALRPQHLQ